MKPYTGRGDDGKSYIKGGRLDKDSVVFEAIGDLDELVSLIGVVRSITALSEIDEALKRVQQDLFHLNSHLAGFLDEFGKEELARIEREAEELNSGLPELRNFVVPASPVTASLLHLCRAVCRRAERKIVRLSKERRVGRWVIPYINRLSSLLFVMARYETIKGGKGEEYLPK